MRDEASDRDSSLSPHPSWSRNSDDYSETRTPRKPIPKSYIRGRRMSRLERGVDRPLAIHRKLLHDAAGGVNECGDPGGGRPQQKAIRFHRPQASLIQMLSA